MWSQLGLVIITNKKLWRRFLLNEFCIARRIALFERTYPERRPIAQRLLTRHFSALAELVTFKHRLFLTTVRCCYYLFRRRSAVVSQFRKSSERRRQLAFSFPRSTQLRISAVSDSADHAYSVICRLYTMLKAVVYVNIYGDLLGLHRKCNECIENSKNHGDVTHYNYWLHRLSVNVLHSWIHLV